jgi:large subunit ribosomal protein L23
MGRTAGKKKDWKKAYIKLKEGEKMIEYFEAV